MLFVFPITLPKNTPATAPVKTILQLSAGVIQKVDIQFPSGCLGLAHISMNDGLHQLWPANAEADLYSSNETIQWDEEYTLGQPPFQLYSSGYNLDTLNDHTLTWRVFVAAQPTVQQLSQQVALLLGNPGG